MNDAEVSYAISKGVTPRRLEKYAREMSLALLSKHTGIKIPVLEALIRRWGIERH